MNLNVVAATTLNFAANVHIQTTVQGIDQL